MVGGDVGVGVVEVGLDSSGLVRGLREDTGEATTSGDATASCGGASDFGLARLETLSGADGSDVRGRSGERGEETTSGGVATGREVGDTVVTTGDNDGDTTGGELLDIVVEALLHVGVVVDLDVTIRN